MVFADWNVRLPSISAQPRQVMILKISPVTGTDFSKYAKSIVKIVRRELARYSVMLITMSNSHCKSPLNSSSSISPPPFQTLGTLSPIPLQAL